MKELTQRIVEYEQGEYNHEQICELFQDLLDCGLVWNLQGHYGRFAYELLEEGYITA